MEHVNKRGGDHTEHKIKLNALTWEEIVLNNIELCLQLRGSMGEIIKEIYVQKYCP